MNSAASEREIGGRNLAGVAARVSAIILGIRSIARSLAMINV
jgi:hypothetical protein